MRLFLASRQQHRRIVSQDVCRINFTKTKRKLPFSFLLIQLLTLAVFTIRWYDIFSFRVFRVITKLSHSVDMQFFVAYNLNDRFSSLRDTAHFI